MNWKAIQQALKDAGFDPGPIDGDPGRKTIAAVTEFQKARGLDIKFPGTVGPKTLAALGVDMASEPPWMTDAKTLLGMHEVTNANVLDKLLRMDTSAIPWCGAMVGMEMAKTLPSEPLPKNPLWARDWLKFGREVKSVYYGAVAVFSREGGGHVGFVAGHDATALHILGGNQSNRVSITRIAKNRLLGYRWPIGYEMPQDILMYSTIGGTLSTNEA